jgi:hypothetical protein
MKKIIIGLLIMIGVASAILVYIDKVTFVVSSEIETAGEYNKEIINTSYVNELMNVAYFEDDNIAYFSSVPLNADISLYNVYWFLKTESMVNDQKYLQERDYTFLIEELNLNQCDSLNDLYFFNYISKEISFNYDKSQMLNMLEVYFMESPFNISVDLQDYAVKDIYDLYLITTLYEEHSELDQLMDLIDMDLLLDVYHNIEDGTFEMENIVYLERIATTFYGENSNQLLIIEIENLINNETFESYIFNLELIKLVHLYDESLSSTKAIILSSISDSTIEDIMYYEIDAISEKCDSCVEPQFMYYGILSKIMINNLRDSDLIYIEFMLDENYDSKYKQYSSFDISYLDTFYGVLISEYIDFPYDSLKVINMLDNDSDSIVAMMRLANDKDLMEVYFYVSLANYYEENVFTRSQKVEMELLLNQIVRDNLDYIDGNLVSRINNIRFSVELLKLLKLDLRNDLEKEIPIFIGEITSQTDINKSIINTELILIMKLISQDYTYLNFEPKNLYLDGGFKYYDSNDVYESDIISTAKMSRVISLDDSSDELGRFLNGMLKENHQFPNSTGDELIHLRVIYYYMKLSTYVGGE